MRSTCATRHHGAGVLRAANLPGAGGDGAPGQQADGDDVHAVAAVHGAFVELAGLRAPRGTGVPGASPSALAARCWWRWRVVVRQGAACRVAVVGVGLLIPLLLALGNVPLARLATAPPTPGWRWATHGVGSGVAAYWRCVR